MTDAMGGLEALMLIGGQPYEVALEDFYARWKDEALVVDKWFAIQARTPGPDTLGRVLGLTAHPGLRRQDAEPPARPGAELSGNPAVFHDPSGAGYRFLADQILATDAFNPMTAARLFEPLGNFRRYTPELAALMKAEVERIVATEGLSRTSSNWRAGLWLRSAQIRSSPQSGPIGSRQRNARAPGWIGPRFRGDERGRERRAHAA